MFVFGIYPGATGLGWLLIPNLLLQVFGVAPAAEVRIRINEMFVLCCPSFYYIRSARLDLTSFIRWTIPARLAVIFYFAALSCWFSRLKALLLFGLIDLPAAIWTRLALKKVGAGLKETKAEI